MEMQKLLAEINALAKKKKEEGLNEAEQKRQKEHVKMVSELQKGDEVLTVGGIAGRIASLDDQYMVLQISKVEDKAVTITMQRQAVQTVLPRGTVKSV